ncbi:MAG: DUF2188 domain-containing protein [Candidatus Methanomethylophilus sp.]|nr:DUF2188 domain-containing protein [Methanomethylophilus sp.]
MLFDWFKRKKKIEEPKAAEPKPEEPKAEKRPVEAPVIINPAPAEESKAIESKAEEKPKTGTADEEPVEEAVDKGYGAYFVSPHPDGGWQVKKAKAKRALKRFDTKAEAEKYAKQVAENQGTNVVRQKKDGKIQKKH